MDDEEDDDNFSDEDSYDFSLEDSFAHYSDTSLSSYVDPEAEMFPIPTSACTVTALESNLFVIGGWNPRHTDDHENLTDRGYVRTIYKYNLYLDLWTTHDFDLGEQGFPIETACHCTFELNNDKLLILGGSLSPIGHNASSDRMYIYSVKNKTWHEIENTCANENKIKRDVSHWWGRAAYLDDASNTLTICTGNKSTFELEIHQLHMNEKPYRWEKLSPAGNDALRFALIKHQIVVYDDKVFVLGGSMHFMSTFRDEGFHASLTSIPTFDLITKKWSYTECSIDNTEYADAWPFAPSVASKSNFVFLTGGLLPNGDRLVDVLRLDLVKKQWITFAKLKGDGRFFHASCLTKDNRLCVYGGCLEANYEGARSNEVELFQCFVPTLYHCALSGLFNPKFRSYLIEKYKASHDNVQVIIDELKNMSLPNFVLNDLFGVC